MDNAWRKFTSEELQIARNASIINVAKALGYTPVRVGRIWTTLKEHDSVIIKNDSSYIRNSVTLSNGKKEGGTAIDFVKNFTGKSNLVEIVQYICELEGYSRRLSDGEKNSIHKKMEAREIQGKGKKDASRERTEFVLPPKADNNKILYAYLMKTRKLDAATVNYFVKNHYIYQSREAHMRRDGSGNIIMNASGKPSMSVYDNLIFQGFNTGGKVVYASKRGMMDNPNMRYRGNVTGSDATCGFNVSFSGSKELCIFEAAIDLMSYCEIFNDFEDTSKLALGTVSDGALARYLKEHENIERLTFCLDADYAGLKASCMHAVKYMGYTMHIDYVEEEKNIDAALMGEDVLVFKLHPDEKVNANKELKQSDTYYMKSILDAVTQLKSLSKYSVRSVSPKYGKDFNECIQYMKAQGMETGLAAERRRGRMP